MQAVTDEFLNAAMENDTELLIVTVENYGLPVDSVGDSHRTALQLAAAWNAMDAIKYLLSRHANVMYVDPDGMTALHLAAENNNAEIVKVLVEAGAVVDVIDSAGYTPLHVAASEGFLSVVKALLNFGADARRSTLFQLQTPSDLAKEGQFTEVLQLMQSWEKIGVPDASMSVMMKWNVEQVLTFLENAGLKAYAPIFLAHSIDGMQLYELTEDQLKFELGIVNSRDRYRIIEAISHLKIKTIQKDCTSLQLQIENFDAVESPRGPSPTKLKPLKKKKIKVKKKKEKKSAIYE